MSNRRGGGVGLGAVIAGLDAPALVEPGVVEARSVVAVLGHVTAWEQQALRQRRSR